MTVEEEACVDARDARRRRRREDPAKGVGCVVFLAGLVFGLGFLRSLILALVVAAVVRAFAGKVGVAARVAAVLLLVAVAGFTLLWGVRAPGAGAERQAEAARYDEEAMRAIEANPRHGVIANWTAGKEPGFVEKLSADPAVLRWLASELEVEPAVAAQYRLVSWQDQIILVGPSAGSWAPKAEAAFRWLLLNSAPSVGGTVSLTKPVSGTEFRTAPPKGLESGGAD